MDPHYVRICLVTIFHEGTNRRYFHPYDLEDSREKTHNVKEDQAVWLPVASYGIDVFKR